MLLKNENKKHKVLNLNYNFGLINTHLFYLFFMLIMKGLFSVLKILYYTKLDTFDTQILYYVPKFM